MGLITSSIKPVIINTAATDPVTKETTKDTIKVCGTLSDIYSSALLLTYKDKHSKSEENPNKGCKPSELLNKLAEDLPKKTYIHATNIKEYDMALESICSDIERMKPDETIIVVEGIDPSNTNRLEELQKRLAGKAFSLYTDRRSFIQAMESTAHASDTE